MGVAAAPLCGPSQMASGSATPAPSRNTTKPWAIDRELYIPRSWVNDLDRCQAVGLPEKTAFATKPDLARQMIERFLDAGHRAAWNTADEVYGGNPKLRATLEARGTSYVPAIACSAKVPTGAGEFRADSLVRRLSERAWQRLSAGAGVKGHHFYDWAVIDLTDPHPGSSQLLIPLTTTGHPQSTGGWNGNSAGWPRSSPRRRSRRQGRQSPAGHSRRGGRRPAAGGGC